MEYIEKNNSLETAKNRLYISGLTYVTSTTGETKYVHDRCVVSNTDDVIKNFLPLVAASGNSDEYILRYKNLVRQYYWLINKFIPSCSLEKLCLRNSVKTWIPYTQTIKSWPKEYVVNYYYYISGVTILISTTVVIEGEKARNFTPNKVGYNFINWFTQRSGGSVFNFNTPITQNTNIYARYSRIVCEVTFHLNNGDDDVVMNVYYGDTPEIEDPVKEGSEFMGWNPSLSIVTGDTEYNATYSNDAYTLRFCNILRPDDLLIGNNYENQPIQTDGHVDTTKYTLKWAETVEYDEASQYYQTTPTYQHFNFAEWVNADGTSITNGEFEHVHGGIIAYAKLSKKIYTVRFNDWENNQIGETQHIPYMEDAEAPTPPSRPNYEFIGWSNSYTGITYDVSIFAQYTGDDLNYSFLLPNSTGTAYDLYHSGTTHYNSSIPTVPSPTTSEYDPYVYGLFDGWYADEEYENKWDSTALITNDTTIYGKWKKNFEVSFYNADNTPITGAENPVYVGYGGDVPQSKLDDIEENVEVPTGYLFTGWDKPTTNIIRDTKITALIGNLQE